MPNHPSLHIIYTCLTLDLTSLSKLYMNSVDLDHYFAYSQVADLEYTQKVGLRMALFKKVSQKERRKLTSMLSN